MRKGFSGLSGLVRAHMDQELMSGDVFIFVNRRRDRIKLLMWDITGFALYYKRKRPSKGVLTAGFHESTFGQNLKI